MKDAKNTISSQLHKANEVLKDMAINVTTSDRAAAMDELNIKSNNTMTNYLKGFGTDLDTAMDLIEFFHARIEERSKTLKSLAAA